MKNSKILIIVCILLLIIAICFFYYVKYDSVKISENIIGKKWYSYNINNGYYSTLYMDDKKIEFKYIKNDDYSMCKKYNYNKQKNEINLDCDKKIYINESSKDKITLILGAKKAVFFTSIGDSLNYEFEKYYLKSISEYKEDMNRVKDLLKINVDSLKEIIDSSETSRVVYMGDSCSTIECTLFMNILEKWSGKYKNLYFVNSNELSIEKINEIKKDNALFIEDINYYNNIYPRIVKYKNGEMIKDTEFKCNGFICNEDFDF